MDCVVAVEGYYVSGQYIAKELTILFDEGNYQHFMFNRPNNLVLTDKDEQTVEYTQKLNGLRFADDSFLPYNVIEGILSYIQNYYIQTAGFHSKRFLKSYLPNTEVVDLCDAFNFKYPPNLQAAPCFVQHPPRYCSLSKARTLNTAIHLFNSNFFVHKPMTPQRQGCYKDSDRQ